jgi:hypothetical protein
LRHVAPSGRILAAASVVALLGRRPRWLPGLDVAAWLFAGIAAITVIDWTVRILLK